MGEGEGCVYRVPSLNWSQSLIGKHFYIFIGNIFVILGGKDTKKWRSPGKVHEG